MINTKDNLVLRPPGLQAFSLGLFPLDLRQKTPPYVQYGERFLSRPAKKSTARKKPKLQAGEALGIAIPESGNK